MTECRLCGSPSKQVLNFGSHPFSHHFLQSPNQEEYVHPLETVCCTRCGLIQIADPAPSEVLYRNYVTLSSWKLNPHLPQIVSMLKSHAQLTSDSLIIEVGCNDGTFLNFLKEQGYPKSVGIEPSEDAFEAAKLGGAEVVKGFLVPSLADKVVRQYGTADVLICRHVLEHITDLRTFAEAFRGLLKPGSVVLMEVPDFGFSLKALDYSAIWEQHSNYFTDATLTYFLELAGIDVLQVDRFVFSGMALAVVGVYAGNPHSPAIDRCQIEEIRSRAERYGTSFPRFKEVLHRKLENFRNTSGPIAAYGAGSRTCSLINFVGIGKYLQFVADDQPEKQGHYMPGSRLPIVESSCLLSQGIRLCLLGVNAENEEKVIEKHRQFETGSGQFRSLHPPSTRLMLTPEEL